MDYNATDLDTVVYNLIPPSELAAEAVKTKLKKLVGDENQKKPLSDSALVKLLEKDDIRIARRTVAKYSEQLGILPYSKRKQMF